MEDTAPPPSPLAPFSTLMVNQPPIVNVVPLGHRVPVLAQTSGIRPAPVEQPAPPLAYLYCIVCRLRVDGRSLLVAYLRQSRDHAHRAALLASNPLHHELRGLHIVPCPHGRGAVNDGGRTSNSRHYDTHVAKRSCKPCEMRGPWCATTVTGIQQAARERLASGPESTELVGSSSTITHCLLHSRFALDHIKHGRVLTSPDVSLLALDLLTTYQATDVVEKANKLSGILRVAAMDEVMLFPSLVKFPHAKRACGTQV